MKSHSRIKETTNRGVTSVTDSLGENRSNPMKKQQKTLSLPNLNTLIISSISRICLKALRRFQLFIAFTEQKKKVPFSMAIANGELMHKCFPKHLRMGTTRMK